MKPPFNAADENPDQPAPNQTYASLPLSFMGKDIEETIKSDQDPARDLRDVQNDIRQIASDKLNPVSWGWYQEGYGHEPRMAAIRQATRATLSTIMARNILAMSGIIRRSPPTCMASAISSPILPGRSCPRRAACSTFGAAMTISMAWSRSTPIRRYGGGFVGNDDHPGIFGRANLGGPRRRRDQRDRGEPLLEGERHHHHL